MKKYLLLLIYLLLAALNFNLILHPLSLVTGGTQGLAIVLNHLLPIRPSLIILIINVTALTISYFFLTKENTYSALVATFAYPFFVKITSTLPTISIIEKHITIAAIIAGTICGLTGGLIYKLGFSSGGTTVINLLAKKYLKIKIAIANFISNGLIIGLGYFIFGLKKTIYSIIVISIGSIIIYLILKKEKDSSFSKKTSN